MVSSSFNSQVLRMAIDESPHAIMYRFAAAWGVLQELAVKNNDWLAATRYKSARRMAIALAVADEVIAREDGI